MEDREREFIESIDFSDIQDEELKSHLEKLIQNDLVLNYDVQDLDKRTDTLEKGLSEMSNKFDEINKKLDHNDIRSQERNRSITDQNNTLINQNQNLMDYSSKMMEILSNVHIAKETTKSKIEISDTTNKYSLWKTILASSLGGGGIVYLIINYIINNF